jgi:ATP adenylyltransferase
MLLIGSSVARIASAARRLSPSHPVRTHSTRAKAMGASSSERSDSLWEKITSRYEAAQACQASLFTETTTEVVCDPQDGYGGFEYIVKIAQRLRDKPKSLGASRSTREDKLRNNPFLPPDPDLYVCRLTETHSLVLNKFNITAHHVIIITDRFEEQEAPLTAGDFDATWRVVVAMGGHGSSKRCESLNRDVEYSRNVRAECLQECEGGMAFFNCGPLSGASQPHKHIQCIPLPIAETLEGIPLDPPFQKVILETLSNGDGAGVREVPSLPFAHGVVGLDELGSGRARGMELVQKYTDIMEYLERRLGDRWERSSSYNLIMTKRYMMVAPRRQESVESVGCNSMGFAGSFFLGTQQEINDLKRLGPGRVLHSLGFVYDE